MHTLLGACEVQLAHTWLSLHMPKMASPKRLESYPCSTADLLKYNCCNNEQAHYHGHIRG